MTALVAGSYQLSTGESHQILVLKSRTEAKAILADFGPFDVRILEVTDAAPEQRDAIVADYIAVSVAGDTPAAPVRSVFEIRRQLREMNDRNPARAWFQSLSQALIQAEPSVSGGTQSA